MKMLGIRNLYTPLFAIARIRRMECTPAAGAGGCNKIIVRAYKSVMEELGIRLLQRTEIAFYFALCLVWLNRNFRVL